MLLPPSGNIYSSIYILFYFSVPYFGLACDHGNSFLCLEEREGTRYWIEVRTVFNVKTSSTTTYNVRFLPIFPLDLFSPVVKCISNSRARFISLP